MAKYIKNIDSSYQIILNVNIKNQDIANNKSVLSYILSVKKLSGFGYWTTDGQEYNININNQVVKSSTWTYDFRNSTIKEIARGEIEVSHNSDGSKVVNVGAFVSMYALGSGRISSKFELPTIPRINRFRIENNSLNFGDTQYIYTSSAHSNFTHTIEIKFLSHKLILTRKKREGRESFLIPTDWINNLPNSTKGTIKIIVYTYNNDKYIGKYEREFIARVPESIKPTVDISISGVNLLDNKYIEDNSRANIRISASGNKGSRIKNIYNSIIQNNRVLASNKNSSYTSPIFTNSGDVTIKSIVIDSRGRKTTASKQINIIEYDKPRNLSFSFERSSNNPRNVNFNIRARYTRINGNSYNTSIYYKKTSDNSYMLAKSYTTPSVEDSFMITNIDENSSYNIRLIQRDHFNNRVWDLILPTGYTLIDFHKGGRGIAIGKVSEGNGIEIAESMDIILHPRELPRAKTTAVTGITNFKAYKIGSLVNLYFEYRPKAKGYTKLMDLSDSLKPLVDYVSMSVISTDSSIDKMPTAYIGNSGVLYVVVNQSDNIPTSMCKFFASYISK